MRCDRNPTDHRAAVNFRRVDVFDWEYVEERSVLLRSWRFIVSCVQQLLFGRRLWRQFSHCWCQPALRWPIAMVKAERVAEAAAGAVIAPATEAIGATDLAAPRAHPAEIAIDLVSSLLTAVRAAQTIPAHFAAARDPTIPIRIYSRQNRTSLSRINPAPSRKARANIKRCGPPTARSVISSSKETTAIGTPTDSRIAAQKIAS